MWTISSVFFKLNHSILYLSAFSYWLNLTVVGLFIVLIVPQNTVYPAPYVYYKEGETATIVCLSSNTTAWTFNDRLTYSPMILQSYGNHVQTLTIRSFEKSLEGNYSCYWMDTIDYDPYIILYSQIEIFLAGKLFVLLQYCITTYSWDFLVFKLTENTVINCWML